MTVGSVTRNASMVAYCIMLAELDLTLAGSKVRRHELTTTDLMVCA